MMIIQEHFYRDNEFGVQSTVLLFYIVYVADVISVCELHSLAVSLTPNSSFYQAGQVQKLNYMI